MRTNRKGNRRSRRHAVDATLAFAGPTRLGDLLAEAAPPSQSDAPATVPMMPGVETWLRSQFNTLLAQAADCHEDALRALDAEKRLRDLAAGIGQLLHQADPIRVDESDDVAAPAPEPQVNYTEVHADRPLGLEILEQPPGGTWDDDTPLYPWFADPAQDGADDTRELAALDGVERIGGVR